MKFRNTNRGIICDMEGVHGPVECGPDPDDSNSCLCGCDDYFNNCDWNMAYWQTLQEETKVNKELL